MKRIRDEVEREFGRFGPAAGMPQLLAAWPAAVGATVARNAWPARIARDGTLHVATSSSAWAFELAQLEGDILPRLRREAGDAAPPAIRFAVGQLPEAPAPEARPREPVAPAPAAVEEAARIAAPIADEELRNLVAKAAAHGLARAGSDRRF